MSKNDITGDSIVTRPASDAYRENYSSIWRKRQIVEAQQRAEKCERCGKVRGFNGDLHTCTPGVADLGYGLCDKCDPDNCCRG